MSTPTYRIRNWVASFQKGGAAQVQGPWSWVPVPTRHDTKGYRRLMRRPDGMQIFAAWIMFVQVAAKSPTRGTLIDRGGPLTVEDIADTTGGDIDTIRLALDVLTDPEAGICWLEICTENDTDLDPSKPVYAAVDSSIHATLINKENKEEKERETSRSANGLFPSEGESAEPQPETPKPSKKPKAAKPKPEAAPEVIPPELDTDEFRAAWASWKRYRIERRKELVPSTIALQLKKLARMGSQQAVAALELAIERRWDSFHEPEGQKPGAAPAQPQPPPKPRQPVQEPVWLNAPDDPEARARNCAGFLQTLKNAGAESAGGAA